MRKRFRPIIPIAVALLLISGLAYAIEKKKQSKPVNQLPDTIHEEEALQAELLAATEEYQVKLPDKDSTSPREIEIAKPGAIKDQLKIKK